jgi:hypothetical protein
MVLMTEATPPVPPQNTPEQDALFLARRRRRSIALGLVLAGIVVIFYVLTIVKLGPNVFDRVL